MACFTTGISIATARGEMPVESVCAGDQLITRDNGLQTVRWAGLREMDSYYLQRNNHLQPVLIQKGSLGHDLPERDMMVSPNQRILVTNDRVSMHFADHEVLVGAKHLLNPKAGIQSINSMGTQYIHLMFDKHEVILANGVWAESFHAGDHSLKALGNAQRSEICEIFPELRTAKSRAAAEPIRSRLKRLESKLLFR